ncbi:hypothetical protein [Luteimonas sp. e5]
MKELHLYPNKMKLMLGTAGAAAFTLGFLWMLMRGPDPDSVFRVIRSPLIYYPIMLGGALLFAFFTGLAVKQVLNPKPRVSLTAEGVTTTGFAGHFNAPWDAFSACTHHGNNILVMRLKDPDDFISRQAEGRPRESARRLSAEFGSPFLIEFDQLAADREAVQQFIKQHLPLQG